MATPTAQDRPTQPRLDALVPAVHVLSNGRYRTLVTESGAGVSLWRDLALTRWSPDPVEDRDGWWIWIRDRETGRVWTPTLDPAPGAVGTHRVTRGYGALRFLREERRIESTLEIAVDPEDDVEVRRLTLTNRDVVARRIEVTGCCEIVLHTAAADSSHPAFSKLFVQTAWEESHGVLVARRRPRANDERTPWLVGGLAGEGVLEFETERARFVGRGSRAGRPVAVLRRQPLAGTVGNVLDPLFAMRRTIELPAGATVTLVFSLGIAEGFESGVACIQRRGSLDGSARVIERAESAGASRRRACGLDAATAEHAEWLLGAMAYGDPRLRAADAVLGRAGSASDVRHRLGLPPASWRMVLRTDVPQVAMHAERLAQLSRYWTELGMPVQMVEVFGNDRSLAESAAGAVRRSELSEAECDALEADARFVLDARTISLLLGRVEAGEIRTPTPVAPRRGMPAAASPGAPEEELLQFNGYGGFAPDGREYVVRMSYSAGRGHRLPPQPWVNVIANETFGTIVSETGAGYTWARNSREYRLTPWSNDPVRDPHGEAFYVRDDATGAFWSPLPGPAPQPADYEMRHGLGYSRCRHTSDELEHETWITVDPEERVKLVRLRLVNRGSAPRRFSLFAMQRLVLGADASECARRIRTRTHADPSVLLAWNPAGAEFAGPVTFAAVVTPANCATHTSTDRLTFLGGHGSAERPEAVVKGRLEPPDHGPSGEACFAQHVTMEIASGEAGEVTFLLGEADDESAAVDCVRRFREAGAVSRRIDAACARWTDLIASVQVTSPAPELDLLVNAWLPYQTLSCRIWGRSAFYQSGGAFGFRDQLQDSMSLLMLDPDLPRAQLLLHAAHQFVEGDVLHWWHPPLSRGMRTRFADDLLWLPHLAATYVSATGDAGVLDERVGFVTAPLLPSGEDEVFLTPGRADERADLYEHCARSIDRSLRTGEHGLPLFGTGDWNDGMNRVGREGRGESVWMAFFLYAILGQFAPIAERRGDFERARRYREHRETLRAAVEREAWDGSWYRRGYYDNGVPLGSAESDECRIDALAQAWAVLSGLGGPDRTREAMESVERHLISDSEGLIRLLSPPFHDTAQDPGYIKGYVPGVRENGGQYTHAAMWVVRAMVELGWRQRAAPLLEAIGPLRHTRTPEDVARYQVEPYVVAADIYGAPPHVGRGGWTWYTGSSGWMYRVVLESIFGLRLEGGETIVLKPCIPDEWPGFQVCWKLPRRGGQSIEVRVHNRASCTARVLSATMDGVPVDIVEGCVHCPLPAGSAGHLLEVEMGA